MELDRRRRALLDIGTYTFCDGLVPGDEYSMDHRVVEADDLLSIQEFQEFIFHATDIIAGKIADHRLPMGVEGTARLRYALLDARFPMSRREQRLWRPHVGVPRFDIYTSLGPSSLSMSVDSVSMELHSDGGLSNCILRECIPLIDNIAKDRAHGMTGSLEGGFGLNDYRFGAGRQWLHGHPVRMYTPKALRRRA